MHSTEHNWESSDKWSILGRENARGTEIDVEIVTLKFFSVVFSCNVLYSPNLYKPIHSRADQQSPGGDL